MVAGSNLRAGVLLLLVIFMAGAELSVGSAGVMWGDGDVMNFSLKKCEGAIGECFPEEEMLMDSESNRRVLATRQYISYDALRADAVPCTKKGNSYYGCGTSGQANPYKRACTQITRCARDTG